MNKDIKSAEEIKTIGEFKIFFKPNMIYCSNALNISEIDYWEFLSGDWEDLNDTTRYYIIDSLTAERLSEDFVDEIVLYNDEFDLYVWALEYYGIDINFVGMEYKKAQEKR